MKQEIILAEHVEFDDGYTEPCAIRALFCAVVSEHWKLAFDERRNDHNLDIKQARDWFGTEGFQEVCELAGVNSRAIYDAFRLRSATCYWGKKYAA